MSSTNRTRRRRELIVVHAGQITLPVREVEWHQDEPRVRRRSPVTAPGYHRGRPNPAKGTTRPATPLDPPELHRLLAAFRIHAAAGRRDQALTAFCAWTGARISEALDVIPVDIDLENSMVTIRHGKGNKRRLIGIAPPGARYTREWLDERAWLGGRPHQVFCTLQHDLFGGRMYPQAYRVALARAAAKAGIEKRVAPHQLRHYLAVELARKKVALPMISRQLGHSNVSTTSTYLAGIAPVEVIDIMVNLPWGEAS